MEQQPFNRQTERSFNTLDARIKDLIEYCEHLIAEKQVLQNERAALLAERDALQAESRQSRARIDAMVMRLKGLEETS